jgi:hypothetical protein
MLYQNKFKNYCGWPNLQITPCSQIPLKFLTDSVKHHVSANKMVTHVILNKKNIHIFFYGLNTSKVPEF